MTPEALEYRQQQRDDAVYYLLNDDWQSVDEIVLSGHGVSLGTVRASLKRLLEDGLIERKWDGNERYGRYLYREVQS